MDFRTLTNILQCNAYAALQPMAQKCFRKEGALKEGLRELSNKEFSILGMFLNYRKNFAFLSRAAEAIGKQYETRTYNDLRSGTADESRGEYVFEELRIGYSAYSYNIKTNGDVCYCVDIYSPLPTFLGVKPSYQFVKHPDGSVSYLQ